MWFLVLTIYGNMKLKWLPFLDYCSIFSSLMPVKMGFAGQIVYRSQWLAWQGQSVGGQGQTRRSPVQQKISQWALESAWCSGKYSGTPFERPPWWEANPSGEATWDCKSKHKCIDFYPWREAIPLERPLFWYKWWLDKRGSIVPFI